MDQHDGGDFDDSGDFGNEASGDFSDDISRENSSVEFNDQRGGGNFQENDSSGWGWSSAVGAGAIGGVVGGLVTSSLQRPRVYAQIPSPYPYPVATGAWHSGANMNTYLTSTHRLIRFPHKFLSFLNFFVVFASIFFIFFCYGATSWTLGFREERLVRGVTSLLVKSITISSNSIPPPGMNVTILSFPTKPPLGDSFFFRQKFPSVSIRRFGYESWRFWLNKGSVVEVSHRLQSASELLAVVLVGSTSLGDWKQAPNTYQGYKYKTRVSGWGSFQFAAEEEGEYFVAIANFGHRAELMNSLDFAVTSATFSKSSLEYGCSIPQSKQCRIELPWGSSRVALIATPTNSMSTRLWNVKLSFSPRWKAYVGIILGTWMLTFILGHCCHRRDDCPSCPPPVARDSAPGTSLPQYQPTPSQSWPDYGPGSRLAAGSAPAAVAPIPTEWVGSSDIGQEQGASSDMCSVCLDAKKDCVLLDCGHRATCLGCAEALMRVRPALCPVCRADIRQVVRVFDA